MYNTYENTLCTVFNNIIRQGSLSLPLKLTYFLGTYTRVELLIGNQMGGNYNETFWFH